MDRRISVHASSEGTNWRDWLKNYSGDRCWKRLIPLAASISMLQREYSEMIQFTVQIYN
jgi:hypothetical protein